MEKQCELLQIDYFTFYDLAAEDFALFVRKDEEK